MVIYCGNSILFLSSNILLSPYSFVVHYSPNAYNTLLCLQNSQIDLPITTGVFKWIKQLKARLVVYAFLSICFKWALLTWIFSIMGSLLLFSGPTYRQDRPLCPLHTPSFLYRLRESTLVVRGFVRGDTTHFVWLFCCWRPLVQPTYHLGILSLVYYLIYL